MILFLTYHKVLRGPEAKPEFYTTWAEQMERQLEMLARTGFHALCPAELLSVKANPLPSYILSFDDGTEDHHKVVLPLLARYNCRAIFFVPTAKLNRAGYLTTQQVSEISRAGHAIGGHSHEHSRLDRFVEEDIRVQMELSRQILGELMGTPPVFFAPPGGFIDARVSAIAFESGVRAIRTMRWGYNRQPNLAALDCIPVNRFFTDEDFGRILKFRKNRTLLYGAKEVTKKLLPAKAYETLRNRVFGFRGPK